jgi:hypothetical protein
MIPAVTLPSAFRSILLEAIHHKSKRKQMSKRRQRIYNVFEKHSRKKQKQQLQQKQQQQQEFKCSG